MDDILKNEKLALDSALGNLARQDCIRYESRICDGIYKFLSASVAVFYPTRPIICWEIRCNVKPNDPLLKDSPFTIYVYESGKAINAITEMNSREDAVREIRSRLSKYMETGYRKIIEKAMTAERDSTLAAIDSLPG